MTFQEALDELRALYRDFVKTAHQAEMLGAKARGIASEYNIKLTELEANIGLAHGYKIDLWGSGDIKPEGECKPVPPTFAQPAAASTPPGG